MRLLYLILSLMVFGFSQAQQASIALSSMNIIYSGINNPVKITVADVDSQNIVVESSSNIQLIKHKHPNWSIFPVSQRQAYVRVGKIVHLDTVWLGKQTFRIRDAAKPQAQLGGIKNDGLPKGKSMVLAQTAITTLIESSFPYSLQYEVTKFSITVDYKDRPAFAETIVGSKLSAEAKEAIGVAYSEDHITFNQIEAKEKRYGLNCSLPPIFITLRNYKKKTRDIFTRLEYLSYSDNRPIINDRNLIDSIRRTTINGSYNLVYTSKWGFYTYSLDIKDSNTKEKRLTDDVGHTIFTLKSTQNNTWSLTFYDQQTGQIKMTCNHNNKVAFIGNMSIQDYITTKRGHSTNETVLDTFFSELTLANHKYLLSPVGPCSTYYKNGNLKATGSLEIYTNRVYKGKSYTNVILPTGFNGGFYNNDISLMHGTWLFYRPNGTLIETRKYTLGVLAE